MKKTILILSILFSAIGFSQDTSVFFEKMDSFLMNNVKDGKVAYDKIHKNQDNLNALLSIAESISVSETTKNSYQAFWINAYNLAVIKGVIDAYPTNSPLDNDGFFDKTKYSLAGQKITLNDIENKLLRAKFKDARFHFVLVCGAVGCPPLINNAYVPDILDSQLERQTKLALNGDFLKIDTKKKVIQASEILKWYKEDFTMNGKTELDFINSYRDEHIPNNYKLIYFTYNWNLNKQ